MRTLEQRVLNKMANSVLRGRFVARASPDPNPKTHRPESRHVFRQNCQAIRETGGLNLIFHRAYVNNGWLVSLDNPS